MWPVMNVELILLLEFVISAQSAQISTFAKNARPNQSMTIPSWKLGRSSTLHSRFSQSSTMTMTHWRSMETEFPSLDLVKVLKWLVSSLVDSETTKEGLTTAEGLWKDAKMGSRSLKESSNALSRKTVNNPRLKLRSNRSRLNKRPNRRSSQRLNRRWNRSK